MTDLIDVVQSTELDDSYIELFDIDLKYIDANGAQQTEYLHLINGLDPDNTNIWMPYENSSGNLVWAEYLATPIEIEGIAVESSGASSRPTITVGNVAAMARSIAADSDGDSDETTFEAQLTALSINKNEDILGSIVTYRRTLLSNTYVKVSGSMYSYDDRSTVIAAVPSPKEFPIGKYVVDRVVAETPILVQFELASPIDVEGLKIPNRYVIGKYCPWEYKGVAKGDAKSGCTWQDTSGLRFDIDNQPVATAAADQCAKTIQACKLRFHPIVSGQHTEEERPLPFGGFPGSRKFK
jgi:lambda family phage minor tail protein L